MDQSLVSGNFDPVFSSTKTSGTSANIGKFVEFFLSNPAQPLHIISAASCFVQHCMEQKTGFRNLAKAPSTSNRVSIFVLLDVAGRYYE